jgi:hypothetical protein
MTLDRLGTLARCAMLAGCLLALAACSSAGPSSPCANTPAAVEIPLRSPNVVIQLRSGSVGGNPVAVDMLGQKSIYVDQCSAVPLDMKLPVSTREKSTVYVHGGSIPPGKAFEITHVAFAGSAEGDSNGHGEFIVELPGKRLVSLRDEAAPIKNEWRGRVLVHPGEESQVRVQIANSSKADVRIDGRFVDAR